MEKKIKNINLQDFLTIAAVRCTCVALFSLSHKALETKLRESNLGVPHGQFLLDKSTFYDYIHRKLNLIDCS